MRSLLVSLVPLLLVTGSPVSAQLGWPPPVSFSLRGEFGVPLGQLADELGQDVGFGIGVLGRATVAPPLSVYIGFDRFRFEGASANTTFRVRDTGFRGGLQVSAPALEGGWATPFAQAGVSYNQFAIDRTAASGTERYRSPRGPGYEVGGGVALTLTSRFWIVPEVRYRARIDEVEAPLEGTMSLQYLGVNLGLLIRIP